MPGLDYLLEQIWVNSLAVAGDPFYLGILVIAFFGVFAFMQRSELEYKMMIMIPGAVLAAAVYPGFFWILVLLFGAILWLALMKFLNR